MINNLSYSSMSAYMRCGFAFKCRYVDKIPGILTGDLIRGAAYHNAVGSALAEKAIFQTPCTLEKTVGIYNQTWKHSVEHKSTDDDGKIVEARAIDFGDQTPEQIRAGGETVVGLYYNQYVPKVAAKEIEVWKRVTHKGIPLVAKVDVITWERTIIDHKTSEKLTNDQEMAKEYQSTFYALTCGFDEVQFELHQAVIKKESEIKVWPVTRTRADIQWLGDVLVQVWSQIQNGIFLPTGMHSYWCGPKACNYWDICRHKLFGEEQIVVPADF